MRCLAIAMSALSFLALSGCALVFHERPLATSFTRHAELPSAPDMFCVFEKFRDVADGRAVTCIAEDLPVGDGHRFIYLLSGTQYQWSFLLRPDRSVSVIHSVSIGEAQAGELEMLRAGMLEAESRLSNRCGMAQAMNGARETCVPMACPS